MVRLEDRFFLRKRAILFRCMGLSLFPEGDPGGRDAMVLRSRRRWRGNALRISAWCRDFAKATPHPAETDDEFSEFVWCCGESGRSSGIGVGSKRLGEDGIAMVSRASGVELFSSRFR